MSLYFLHLEDEITEQLVKIFEHRKSTRTEITEVTALIKECFSLSFDNEPLSKSTSELLEDFDYKGITRRVNLEIAEGGGEPDFLEPQITDKERRG